MDSVKGFLLSYLKYGDNDAVTHFFTVENGYESFFIRGIYSPKSKKKAYLQPLKELSLTLSEKKGGSIKNVTKVEAASDIDFDHDMKINTVIFFISDFLNQVLRNENKNKIIYEEIEEFLSELKTKNFQCHLVFLFKILKTHGLSPLLGAGSYLNPETGNFVSEKTHHLFNEDISEIWKILSESQNPYEITISPKFRKTFLESLLVFYHYHFTDFRTPSSLEIVQQIFQD